MFFSIQLPYHKQIKKEEKIKRSCSMMLELILINTDMFGFSSWIMLELLSYRKLEMIGKEAK